MEAVLDQRLRDELDKQFGTHESVRELKQAIYLSRKGQITDEVVEQYKKHKEHEMELYRRVMTEVNPDYAFKVGEDLATISGDNAKEDVTGSECIDVTIRDSDDGRNENVAPEHQVQPVHATQRRYEITRDV